MLQFVCGVYIVLHGLVHVSYAGQGARRFELNPGMVWPEGSWAFSRLLGDEATRKLASISLALAAIGFVAGGIGMRIAAQHGTRNVRLFGSAARGEARPDSVGVLVEFEPGRTLRVSGT